MAPSEPSADYMLGQRVLRESIASVYSTYIVSTLTHMAFVLVFGAIIYSQLKDPSLLFWLAALRGAAPPAPRASPRAGRPSGRRANAPTGRARSRAWSRW